MIASVERAKKRNLQAAHAFILDEAGVTLDLLPFPGLPIESLIYHDNLTALFPGIMGGHTTQIALKGMVQSGNLIPCAQIPIGLKSGHRLQAFRHPRATIEQQGHKEPYPYRYCHLLHVIIDLLPLSQRRGNLPSH